MPLRSSSAVPVMIASPRGRPPSLEPLLKDVEQRNHGQPRGHEQERADEHDVGLKRVAGVRDQMAKTRRGRIKLADNDPKQRAAGAVFRAREDEGNDTG